MFLSGAFCNAVEIERTPSMSTPKFYAFFGAPAGGKSTCIRYLKKKYGVVSLIKESTRSERTDIDDEIKCVSQISESCDLRYTLYGKEYGLDSADIWENFSKGRSQAVVINDVRTLKLAKKWFGSSMMMINIHTTTSKDKISEIERARYRQDVASADEIGRRFDKTKAVHRKYIENSTLFDATIINVGSREQLHRQVDAIIHAEQRSQPSQLPSRIFAICGASLSGKEKLVLSMQRMDPTRSINYKKGTTRPSASNDEDAHTFFSSEQELRDQYDIVYRKQGYHYGVNSNDLWNSLKQQRVCLLVINDVNSIKKLKEQFGEFCTVLYLHADITLDEMEARLRQPQMQVPDADVSKRIQVSIDLYNEYCEHMGIFDHVLLNTTEMEDLYDQTFNVFERYLT